MYVLKRLPEDFVVEELARHDIKEKGRELLLRVTKRGQNTEEIALALAKAFRVPRKAVGYAGTKDKEAVTTQYFTVRGKTQQDLQRLSPSSPHKEELELAFVGYLAEGLCLGMLDGNRFTITLRNLGGDEDLSLPAVVPNYYDEQRFQVRNVRIGEALVRGEFAAAADSILEDSWHKRKLEAVLAERPNDYVGGLATLPVRILRMYLHAFQSRLWNEVLARYIEDEAAGVKRVPYSQGSLVFSTGMPLPQNTKLPLPGFGSESDDSVEPAISKYVDDVLKTHSLKPRDFVIKAFPNLSMEGDTRDAFMTVSDFACEGFADDEFHPGKKKAILSFSLGKGSYATMLVKAIFAASSR